MDSKQRSEEERIRRLAGMFKSVISVSQTIRFVVPRKTSNTSERDEELLKYYEGLLEGFRTSAMASRRSGLVEMNAALIHGRRINAVKRLSQVSTDEKRFSQLSSDEDVS